MRTLQEKYNGVNEGAFSKDQFLRDARLQLPNLVTQYNGYDDAVQILKNRGMIQEEKKETSTAELMRLADEIPTKELLQGLSKDAIDGLKKLAKNGKEKLGRALVKFGYLEPGDLNEAKKEESFKIVWDKSKLTRTTYENGKQYQSKKFKTEEELVADKEKADAVQKKREEKGRDKITHTLKEARLTKSNLTDYRYKPTNDMDKYPYEQILRGLRVELEGLNVLGTPTPEEYTKALAKVLKNLEKDGIFYTNQIAGIKANKKRTDLMIDATPKTVVDKENGLQKAALKEAIKSVIKNILKEDDSSVSGLYDDEDQYKMYPGDRDVYGAEDIDEELWDLFSPYIHDDSDIEDQMDAYKEGGFSALSKELQDHLKDDRRFKNWTSTYGRSEVEGDEDDEEFSRDLPFEGTGLSPEIFESVSLMDILDEGSSKHSTEWHKGYKAFNDDKKLSSNPYKENPQKKDWAAGWDKAQSDESDSYKGY